MVQAINALCQKYPRKHAVLMNFLFTMLREEVSLQDNYFVFLVCMHELQDCIVAPVRVKLLLIMLCNKSLSRKGLQSNWQKCPAVHNGFTHSARHVFNVVFIL